jgi:ERCC4-related helicase
MTAKETQNLHKLMRKQFNRREPCQFQVNLTKAQEEQQDAICQAATGMGKTAVTAKLYMLPKNERRVTIMISPLIGLQNKMVCQPFINPFISHWLF